MSETIAAVSTPMGAGGIGVIRISGDRAIEIADRVVSTTSGRPLSCFKGYTAAHGRVRCGNEAADECVALVYREPKSYTGEDTVEISCHGGMYVTNQVLRAVLGEGAVPAGPGEFTKRAFLNGKLDLSEAEAVMELIGAQNEGAMKVALNMLEGRLSSRINGVCDRLLAAAAQLGAWVDYPDEDIPELTDSALEDTLVSVKQELEELAGSFDTGRVLTAGADTVIVGKPNVGKSALMNMLSGFSRSIVTDIAGTTRDVVEETVTLGNVTLRLADTAGIRESEDTVESIGVQMAKKRMERAQLILAVFDCSEELDSYDRQILELCRGKRAVAVINKTDLPTVLDIGEIEKYIGEPVLISAEKGEGEKELSERVNRLLGTDSTDTTRAMLTTERQRQTTLSALEAVEQALGALEAGFTMDAINVCIDDAVGFLLELTGKRAGEAVVEQVFSRFCVGK